MPGAMMPSCDSGQGRTSGARRPGKEAMKWSQGLFSMEGPGFSSWGFQKVLTLSGINCECKPHRDHFPRICWFPFLNCQQHIDSSGTSNESYSELINASPFMSTCPMSLKRNHPQNITYVFTLFSWTDHFVLGIWGESPAPPVANALGHLGSQEFSVLARLPSHRSAKENVGPRAWRQLNEAAFFKINELWAEAVFSHNAQCFPKC